MTTSNSSEGLFEKLWACDSSTIRTHWKQLDDSREEKMRWASREKIDDEKMKE